MYSVINTQPEDQLSQDSVPPLPGLDDASAAPFPAQARFHDVLPQNAATAVSHPTTVTLAKNPWILKRLKQIHKDAAVLSMQGLSREKVAEFCGKTEAWVTLVCKQPLVQAYISELEAHADLRLRGMYEKSLDALDAGFASPKISDKLAAAGMQLRAIGKDVHDPSENKQTAEDVVSAMLIQATNVQVNNYQTGGK